MRLSKKVKGDLDTFYEEVDPYDDVSSYALVYKDKIRPYHNMVCHARMNDFRESKGCEMVITAIRTDHEYTDKLLRWVVLDSPWSKYILNKTAKSVRTEGLKVGGDTPSVLMLNVITLIRQMWEYPDIITLWGKLVERGLKKETALIMAHYGEEGVGGRWEFRDYDNNHNFFSSRYLDDSVLLNLVNRTPEMNDNGSTPYNKGWYRGESRTVWSSRFESSFCIDKAYAFDVGEAVNDKVNTYTGWGGAISSRPYSSLNNMLRQLYVAGKAMEERVL